VGFHDINRAFDLLQQGRCLRCIIWMDRDSNGGAKDTVVAHA
jgi:hypothetical protein